jgi:hypothetical protein
MTLGSLATNANTFQGYIDDIRIYNRALTAAQVLQLYTNNASSTTLTPYLTPRSVLYTTPSLPANAWTKVAFTIPGDTAGLWASDNTTGLTLSLCLGASPSSLYGLSNIAAASNNAASVWNNAIGYADTSNQNQLFGASSNNFLANIGNSLLLTGVQLEAGPVATPFESRPFAAELAAAQRYYETSYDVGTAPGTVTSSSALSWSIVSANRPSYHVPFDTPKRVTPSITLYNPNTANTTGLRNISSSSSGAGTIEAPGANGFRVFWQVGNTGQVVGDTISGHFVANAEL